MHRSSHIFEEAGDRAMKMADTEIERIKAQSDYKNLSPLMRAYIDCLYEDAQLLRSHIKTACEHIDGLDRMLDVYQSKV